MWYEIGLEFESGYKCKAWLMCNGKIDVLINNYEKKIGSTVINWFHTGYISRDSSEVNKV